jgi:hypothetical protein
VSEPLELALIVAVGPALLGTASLVLAIKNTNAIHEVHLSLNSRLDELLKTSNKAAYASGIKEGEKRERER